MKNPDIFGYYQVGNQKYYSKLEAIEEHTRTGIHPHWNFNEDVFGVYNWQEEPKDSLAELYRRRAQQLRDNYDYLILWYSGGSDSDNILNTFVNNDIKLDEIVSYSNYEATGDKYNFLNGEIFNVAIPKIKKLKDEHPELGTLKHRIIDLSQMMVDWFKNPVNQFDWIYHLNIMVSVNGLARQDIHQQIPEWFDIMNTGKKVAFIHGSDKPRIIQNEQGEYIFRFLDIIDSNAVSARNQTLNRIWENNELFYWTPDLPDIVIKQSHIIKRYLQSATRDTEYMTDITSGLAYKLIDGKPCWIKVAGVHTLIYPNWQPIPYQVKPASPLFSPRDHWFREFSDKEVAFKVYKNGLIKRWQMIPDYWKNDPADIYKGYKCSWSCDYNLGI